MGRRAGMAGIAAAILLAGLPAGAQSLAEVARKERERRAGLAGESPVIGNSELETRDFPAGPVASEEPPAAGAAAGAGTGEPVETEPGPTDKEVGELRAKWSRIWQEQMDEARAVLAKAKDDVYQCRSAARFFFVPIAVDCDGVFERLAEAEARLREVKRNRYNWESLLPR